MHSNHELTITPTWVFSWCLCDIAVFELAVSQEWSESNVIHELCRSESLFEQLVKSNSESRIIPESPLRTRNSNTHPHPCSSGGGTPQMYPSFTVTTVE